MIKEEVVNKFAAKKLRDLRAASGFSQGLVGSQVGVSYQQVQKYEWDINRMTPGRLMQFAELFEVPIIHFFPDANALYSESPSEKSVIRFIRILNQLELQHHNLAYACLKAIAKSVGTKG